MKLEIDIQKLQQCKLFVATPMYGGQCTGLYTKSCISLSQLLTQYGINAQFSFLFNESLIQRARNYLTDEFLRSDCTHLMFIDGDIDYDPADILALLALDRDIVGGPYPKKCIAWESIKNACDLGLANENPSQLERFVGDYVFNLVPGTTQIKIDEPVEVMEIGTGFMLIKREVFTRFLEAYPDHQYTPDHNRSEHFNGARKIGLFFDCRVDPVANRYLSEDYYFCQKVREAGLSVWLCPWMKLRHVGTYIFGGSMQDLAQLDMMNRQRRGEDPAATFIKAMVAQAANPSSSRQLRRSALRELEKHNVSVPTREDVIAKAKELGVWQDAWDATTVDHEDVNGTDAAGN